MLPYIHVGAAELTRMLDPPVRQWRHVLHVVRTTGRSGYRRSDGHRIETKRWRRRRRSVDRKEDDMSDGM
jgi:hypothetical protein